MVIINVKIKQRYSKGCTETASWKRFSMFRLYSRELKQSCIDWGKSQRCLLQLTTIDPVHSLTWWWSETALYVAYKRWLNLHWGKGSWCHQMETFSRYWPFVQGIHRSSVNSPNKGQWRGALVFSLICTWINGWVNNRETDDLRRHRAHYDVIVM